MIFINVLARLSIAATLCVTVVGLQFIGETGLQSQSMEISEEQIERSEEELSVQLELLKHSPNLGFGNILANAIFVQFLQYFGDDEARKQSGYAKSPEFFDALISQDPCYRDFYTFLSGSSTLYAGKPEKSVEIAASGLAKLSPNQPPDGYYIWRYKAVDELLFLGDNKAAQKSFSSAASWAAESTDDEAELIGHLSQKTANFLADNPNSKIAQIDAWGSLLTTALDKNTRARAIVKIEELGGSVVISEDGGISIQYEKVKDADKSSNSSNIRS